MEALKQELRKKRREVMKSQNLSLRELYKLIEDTPNNPVSEIQNKLDNAVREVYGMKKKDNVLEFLLTLNFKLYEKEQKKEIIIGPGLPDFIKNVNDFVSEDCIKF